VFQRQEFPQKIALRAAEQRHVRARLTAAQNRAQRNQYNLMQRMTLGIARARVFQLIENILHLVHGAPLPSIGAFS